MFYSIAATQENFELLVLLALLLNLAVFMSITFMPSIYTALGNWATKMVDRLFKGISTPH